MVKASGLCAVSQPLPVFAGSVRRILFHKLLHLCQTHLNGRPEMHGDPVVHPRHIDRANCRDSIPALLVHVECQKGKHHKTEHGYGRGAGNQKTGYPVFHILSFQPFLKLANGGSRPAVIGLDPLCQTGGFLAPSGAQSLCQLMAGLIQSGKT